MFLQCYEVYTVRHYVDFYGNAFMYLRKYMGGTALLCQQIISDMATCNTTTLYSMPHPKKTVLASIAAAWSHLELAHCRALE